MIIGVLVRVVTLHEFTPDEVLDTEKIHLAKRVLGSISLDHIHHLDREFLLYKLKM
jgi:hypothetical protein